MDKTTQQIIDEDFEGGLTMGQLQCKDCNDNLTDCTCIEDTVDMKQETLNEVALEFAKDHHEMYETNNFGAMHFGFSWGAKWQQERSYSEEDMREAIMFGANGMYGWQMGEEGYTNNQIKRFLKTFKKK